MCGEREMSGKQTQEGGMSKVTIIKGGKTGILTRGEDGRWDMQIDDVRAPANNYYTDEQVARIVDQARAAGHEVTTV
jgi:hypothetical protein